jgi:hypothetical protein
MRQAPLRMLATAHPSAIDTCGATVLPSIAKSGHGQPYHCNNSPANVSMALRTIGICALPH